MPEAVRVSWGQDAEVRVSGRERALGPQWPAVEQPQPRWERSVAMIRRTWGQYSSLSLSPTHLWHTTNITLSRLSVRDYIFIKKCVRSFIEVHILCLVMFCLYVCGYTTTGRKAKTSNSSTIFITGYSLPLEEEFYLSAEDAIGETTFEFRLVRLLYLTAYQFSWIM